MYIDLGTAVNLALKEGRKSHDVILQLPVVVAKDTLYREYSSLFLWKSKYILETRNPMCHRVVNGCFCISLCRKWDLDERFLESRRRSILREHQQLSGRHRN